MQMKKAFFVTFMVSLFVSGLYAGNKKYSNEEIYSNMCSKCHGIDGEGNPKKKGPALNNIEMNELEISLFDLRSGGAYQSSGTDHDVMEHNMQKIIEKGMDYEPKDMAKYIFLKFNPEAKYYKETKSVDKNYTVSEIYGKMCSKCHGINAEGNPKKDGPALNNKLAYDIEMDIIDIQKGNMSQSSGSDHDVMEHNQEKIVEKGMSYDAKEMATYIETHFYKK